MSTSQHPNLKHSLRLGSAYPVLEKTKEGQNQDAQKGLDIQACLGILKPYDLTTDFETLEAIRLTEETKIEKQESSTQEKEINLDPGPNKRAESNVKEKFSWLRDMPAYASWIKRAGSRHLPSPNESLRLWIHGGGSATRTHVALFVTRDLRKHFRDDKEVHVFYFFCSRQAERRNTASAMVKAFLYLLLTTRPYLCKPIRGWLSEITNRQHNFEDAVSLWAIFRRVLSAINGGVIFCVIDCLEDLDDEDAKLVASLVSKDLPGEACTGNSSALRVLITGRADPHSSRKFNTINLDDDVGEVDKQGYPHELSLQEIRTYVVALDDKPKAKLKIHVEALQFAALLQVQPTMDLLTKLITAASGSAISRKQLHMRLQVPPAFIRFRSATIYFKHRRIRDAFASDQDVGKMHRNTEEAHEQIATWCLKVLGEQLPDIGLTRLKTMDLAQLNEVATDMSPELRYAIVHWATHVRLSSNDSNSMLDRIVDVFAPKTQGEVLSPKLHRCWIIYCALQNGITHQELEEHPKKVATALIHTMVRFGLYDLLVAAQKNDQYWKTFKLGISTQDYTYSTPTQLAITRHDARMLNFLRTVGGELLFQEHHYRRACGTNIEILDLVWQHWSTAPVRMPENKMITCLLRAISTGDEALLLRVIQHLSSIKPAVLPCIATSSLVQAMMTGHTHLLPPLLEITRLDKKRAVRVIAEAVRSREHSALAMLLASGPIAHLLSTEDGNARSIMGFPNLISSLNLAIERHCPEMVDTLLSSSNVRLRDDRGRTPLFVAALSSDISSLANIILYLPPNFFSFATSLAPEVGVALHLLIHNVDKHPSVPLYLLETFIDLGARIKAKDFGFTALHAAAAVDSTDVMKLLLDKAEIESGVDEQVSALHGEEWEGKTALSIAAGRGNVEMVRMLVGSGADIGVKDRAERRAITLAMEEGHGGVVEVLRDAMWKDVSMRKRSTSI